MKRLTIDAALELVAPHAEAFHDLPNGAWDDLHRLTPDELLVAYSQRTRASAVHDLMVKKAAKYAARSGGSVRMFERQQMIGMVINGLLAIRFKKLDEDGQSRNQPSRQVDEFRAQRQLEGIDAVHNLELGYVLNESETEIAQVRLVYPAGKGIYWSTLIGKDGPEPEVFGLPFSPVDPNPPRPPVIKPKKSGDVVPLRRRNKEDED